MSQVIRLPPNKAMNLTVAARASFGGFRCSANEVIAVTFRTVTEGNYDDYLEFESPAASDGAVDARAADRQERQLRLAAFPHCVLLQVAYAELDYANQWCWQQFGPAHGECQQASSDYPACSVPNPHAHDGRWLTHWLVKTAYNFGYNEWYFAQETDQERFLEFAPHINFGGSVFRNEAHQITT